MLGLIICLVLFIYAISQYNSGRKDKGAFVFFLFISDGFRLLHPNWLGGLPLKYTDFALLYILFVLFRNSNLISRSVKSISIYKWFLILVLYLTANFLWTVSTGVEIFSMSLATWRGYLMFLSFLVIFDLSDNELQTLMKRICSITLITALIFVTQPLHQLHILDGLTNGIIFEEGSRYRNIPILLYFVLIYLTITMDFSNQKKLFWIAVSGMSVVLTQHRAVMLGYAAVVALYLFFSKDMKRAMQYVVMGVIALLSVGSMVFDRFENEGKTSTSDDIQNVLTMDYRQAAMSGYDDEGGTFAFRILLFVERFDYFQQHPQYMFTGVGMRHEDSPRTSRDFNFILGSRKLDKELGLWLPQQISSGDMVWFTPFVKFGLVGLTLYIIIMIVMFRFFNRNKKISILSMAVFLYYVLLMIISVKNDMLFGKVQLSFLFIFIELIRRQNQISSSNGYTLLDFNPLKKK